MVTPKLEYGKLRFLGNWLIVGQYEQNNYPNYALSLLLIIGPDGGISV